MRFLTRSSLLISLALAAELSAQSDVAFVALRASHLGALTPLITPAMISRRLNGAQLGLRYGFREEFDLRTQAVALSGIFGLGLSSSVALTAGVTDADCFSCSPALMLGLGGDMRVYESGGVAGGPAMSIAVSGDIGYAQLKPGDNTAVLLGVGAPVTLAFGATTEGGMRFAPFVNPAFGIGAITSDCPVVGSCPSGSGTRWMLGGGIGVWNPLTSVSASVGVNHIFFEDSRPVFGVNVQIGGR